MSDQPFIATTKNQGVTRLSLNGFLDLQTAAELEGAIKKLIRGKQYRLAIDCAELTYISSAGLGVFMGYIDEVRERQGNIVFFDVLHDKVKETFDLVNFAELFDIVADYEEAVLRFPTDPKTGR